MNWLLIYLFFLRGGRRNLISSRHTAKHIWARLKQLCWFSLSNRVLLSLHKFWLFLHLIRGGSTRRADMRGGFFFLPARGSILNRWLLMVMTYMYCAFLWYSAMLFQQHLAAYSLSCCGGVTHLNCHDLWCMSQERRHNWVNDVPATSREGQKNAAVVVVSTRRQYELVNSKDPIVCTRKRVFVT